jgi:hypothetical protein
VGVFNGREMATGVLKWSTAAPAASPAILLQGRFNLTLSGSFTGLAATLERSFDGGTTWVTCSSLGAPVVFTAAASEVCEEREAGVFYRVNVTAIASGSVSVRLSQ